MKNYKAIIKKIALAQLDPADTGSFMIKAEVPLKDINKFREEYKQLKGMGRFQQWDFNREDQWKRERALLIIEKNKYSTEFRVHFNAAPDQLEVIKARFGDRVKNIVGKGAGEYLYRLDDNTFARELIKNGADIGRNDFPLPV